ncbi:MAG: hypothetical protein ACLRSW_10695 [Christensenellaceae bacterium]
MKNCFYLLTGIMTASLAGWEGKKRIKTGIYASYREDLMWNTEELFNRAVTAGRSGRLNANGTTKRFTTDRI